MTADSSSEKHEVKRLVQPGFQRRSRTFAIVILGVAFLMLFGGLDAKSRGEADIIEAIDVPILLLGLAVWALKQGQVAGVYVSDDALTVRSAFRKRRVPWWTIVHLEQRSSWDPKHIIQIVTNDGQRVPVLSYLGRKPPSVYFELKALIEERSTPRRPD